MKTKLLFICALLFAMGQSFAQVYVFEPFDYTAGPSLLTPAVNTNPVTNTTWNNYTNGSPNDMAIEANPTGWTLGQAFDLNPTGNAVTWKGGGEDGELDFPAVSGEGNVIYLSFFIDIVGWSPTIDGHRPDKYRHVNLGINDAGNVGSGLGIGPTEAGNDNKFRLFLMNSDKTDAGDIAYFPTEFTYTDLGTDATPTLNQFFIVIKYVIGNGATDGTGTGTGYMWVNPAVTGAEPAPDVTHQVAGAVRNRTKFQSVLLQARSNNSNPLNYVDEIRVAGSWEEATGQPALSVSDNVLGSKFKVYPNPVNDVITIASKNIDVTSVSLYSVLGKQVLSGLELKNNSLNISELAKGVYFLKINSNQGTVTKRIIKK